MLSLAQAQFDAALDAATEATRPAHEKVAMLVEIAMGLQSRPRNAEDFLVAIRLYRQALIWAGAEAQVSQARIRARLATALHLRPGASAAELEEAAELLQESIPVLGADGAEEEAAEAELNLGLVLQEQAAAQPGLLAAAIAAYQRALRVFRAERYPAEFALLHNNLATAYLAGAGAGPTGQVREALAVQSYQAALTKINLVDHPREYAMLQNNLGNALQYARSGHALDNNLRALDAYAEALKVRDLRRSPVEYANTLANRALCLLNLPDGAVEEFSHASARADQHLAEGVFRQHGDFAKAEMLRQSREEFDEQRA